MSWALALLAALFIGYCVLRLPQRPGLFAGVIVSVYNLSIYFGPIGAPVGLFALVIAAARLAATRERPPLMAEGSLLAWAGLCLVSVLYAARIEPALDGASQLIGFLLPSYLYGRAFGGHPRFVPDFILASTLALIVCEPGVLMNLSWRSTRIAGDLNAVGMSLLLDVALIGCIARLMLDRTLDAKRVAGLTALLLAVLLPIAFMLGTRGVFVATGVAFALLFARRFMEGGRMRLVVGVIVVAGAVVLAWLLIVTSDDPRFARSAMRLLADFKPGQTMQDPAAQMRVQFYGESLDLAARAPFFGHGLESFGVLADNAMKQSPHNMFLEIVEATGLAGLVLFLGGLLPVLFASLRAMFRRPLDWTGAFICAALVDSLMRHQLSLSVLQGKILFLLLGLSVARTYPPRAAQGLPSTAGRAESAALAQAP